ncbi:MAG: HEAT repeat domain-containing protein, partial [Planctomycetaceae bacterium]|nr:HEAT repeat domain-containing protein [Planctomycetaceae bacterium]
LLSLCCGVLLTDSLLAEPVALPVSGKAGEQVAYLFEMEADDGTVIRNFRATPILKIDAVENGNLRISVGETSLKEEHKFKNPQTRGIIRNYGLPISREARSLTIDPRCRIVTSKGEIGLPFAQGELLETILEARPEAPQDQWERTRDTTLTISSSLFPRLLLSDPNATRLNAEETVAFRVLKVTEQEVTLERTYSFTTVERSGDGPRYEMSGKGELKIGRADGFPQSFDGRVKITTRDEGSAKTTDIHLGYARMTPDELKNYRTLLTAEADARIAPPSPQERQEFLDVIQGGEALKMRDVLDKIAPKMPEGEDAEVAAVIAKCLTHDQNFVQVSAAKAMINWATEAEAAALIDSLKNTNSLVTKAAEQALVRLNHTAAIPAIVDRVKAPATRIPASKALQQFGSVAEEEVHKLFTENDRSVRMEAAKILGEIGTSKSLPLLEDRAVNDTDNTVKYLTKKALDAVRARVQNGT